MASPSPSLQTKLDLERGGLVRIMGPAKLIVIEGCVRIIGLNICKGESIIINRYRSYCIKALENSIINIVLGEGGSIEKPNPGEEVVDAWESIARVIVEKGGTVLVLGAIESGKTSFSTLLSNIAIEMGKKPCIVDADVGQGDLAPPTFIGMKCFDKKVFWLREEKGDYIKFIGALTPSFATSMAKIISSTLDLVLKAKSLGRDLIIVNTDGWFGDSSSIEYKYVLIKSLLPSVIVVLDLDLCSAFKAMLKNMGIDVYCLPKPKIVKERSREDRRDLRKINYQKWFNNMKKVCVNINNIAIVGACILNGMPIPAKELEDLEKTLGIRILYSARYADFDVIAVPDDTVIPRELVERLERRVIVVKPSNAKGVISSILDKNLNEVGVAIIDEIDLINGRICVSTSYTDEIYGLIIGKVKLDEQWNDSIRYPKCVI
ncbi:MAG: Clp1/GlmU family protein [Ignisphaera sp.]